MIKKAIRCKVIYARVNKVMFNIKVYLPYKFKLATCLNCGELFLIDPENPNLYSLNLNDITEHNGCPSCNSFLSDSIAAYPENIWLAKEKIGKFDHLSIYNTESKDEIVSFYLLTL